MKDLVINSLGFDLTIKVPESIEEYDRLAKKEGAALESAIMNVVYRGVNNRFRAAFADAVENNTGISRKTEQVMGKDGQPKVDPETKEPVLRYTETEQRYFDRVAAQLVADKQFESEEAAKASFLALAQSIIAGDGTEANPGIVFDPSETERVSTGPKKVAKQYTKLAEQWAAAGKLEGAAELFQSKLGATWKVEATVESVARAISEDQRRKREAQTLANEYAV